MSNLQGVWSLVSQYQAIGNNNQADPLVGDVGLIAKSQTASVIEFVNIASDGNAEDFGDKSNDQGTTSACGSSTRALFRVEYITDNNLTLEFCEISRKGNTSDFGDLIELDSTAGGALSNNTRGIFLGGSKTSVGDHDQIEYVTIASTGNATDFGNMNPARDFFGTLASSTRGVSGMGRVASGDYSNNVIDYITIASTGNASDFGDMSVARLDADGVSSSTRGVFGGGYNSQGAYSGTSSRLNVMDYITIASTGNATDFGDLTAYGQVGGTSNKTKGIFIYGVEIGFSPDSADTNTIDKITIASTGNATDFGDMSQVNGNKARATSNSHGGI